MITWLKIRLSTLLDFSYILWGALKVLIKTKSFIAVNMYFKGVKTELELKYQELLLEVKLRKLLEVKLRKLLEVKLGEFLDDDRKEK